MSDEDSTFATPDELAEELESKGDDIQQTADRFRRLTEKLRLSDARSDPTPDEPVSREGVIRIARIHPDCEGCKYEAPEMTLAYRNYDCPVHGGGENGSS